MGSPDKPKPTAKERALSKRGAREFNDYIERYVPIEEKFLEASKATPAVRESVRGAAQAEAGLQEKKAREGLDADLASGGAALSSGRSVSMREDLSQAHGEGGGLGQAVADRGAQEREDNARMKMTAYGRGLADQSSVGLRQAGIRAQEEAAQAQEIKAQQRANLLSSAVTAGGLGAAKYKANKAADDFASTNPMNRYRVGSRQFIEGLK